LIRIGRYEPTSQACSTCGTKDGPKPLDVREWTCPACGAVHDRDVNAAINVKKAAGLCGDSLRSVGKTGTPRPAPRAETGSQGFPPEPCAA
ncbi:zinc ribbon domain-containing protein, partial [Streptomyces sp. NPDC002790]|uniref:zinc ribbon domain-containing protein n=1 Tax=Streptomyces sp. NPDC002790 TaxID=3154431 RepID=UPI00332C6739